MLISFHWMLFHSPSLFLHFLVSCLFSFILFFPSLQFSMSTNLWQRALCLPYAVYKVMSKNFEGQLTHWRDKAYCNFLMGGQWLITRHLTELSEYEWPDGNSCKGHIFDIRGKFQPCRVVVDDASGPGEGGNCTRTAVWFPPFLLF